jgi:hypothetical protein
MLTMNSSFEVQAMYRIDPPECELDFAPLTLPAKLLHLSTEPSRSLANSSALALSQSRGLQNIRLGAAALQAAYNRCLKAARLARKA